MPTLPPLTLSICESRCIEGRASCRVRRSFNEGGSASPAHPEYLRKQMYRREQTYRGILVTIALPSILISSFMCAMNPDQENRDPNSDLTYNADTDIISVFYKDSRACNAASYNLRTCKLRIRAQTLQTPPDACFAEHEYDVTPTWPLPSSLRLLINRIRTFLIFNNHVYNVGPALAHMHHLFYTLDRYYPVSLHK